MLSWIAQSPKEQWTTKEYKGEWKTQINTFCFIPINIDKPNFGFCFVNKTKLVGLEKSHAEEQERDITNYFNKYVLSVQNNMDKSIMMEKWQGKWVNKVLQW